MSLARHLCLTAGLLLLSAGVPAAPAAALPSAPQSAQALFDGVLAKAHPDTRTTLFDVRMTEGPGRAVTLSGVSDSSELLAELRAVFLQKGYALTDELALLPQGEESRDELWALVNVPSVTVADTPNGAVRALWPLGTPARWLRTEGAFMQLRWPDGTVGWTAADGMLRRTAFLLTVWNRHDKLRVTTDDTPLFDPVLSSDGARRELMRVPAGTDLRVIDETENGALVFLPDARRGFLMKGTYTPLEKLAEREENQRRERPEAFRKALAATAQSLAPSLTDPDGSVLVRRTYAVHDLTLPRDADLMQQAFPAVKNDRFRSFQAGDLLFFRADKASPLTMAVSLGGSLLMRGGHKTPDDLLKNAGLRKTFAGAVRPDPGFLNDPCLTSSRSSLLRQAPPKLPVPCSRRSEISPIR